ncbi:MAG TPA: DUF5979 domain-containing protein [Acidimicrobiales bacterium]|nr:DUF5979 domain-containing protein [Acidimicrobiales bacterium]
MGLLLALMLVPTVAAGAEDPKKPPMFVGYCEPGEDPSDGTCVLDEPEGQNPDTYGVVTYERIVAAGSDVLRLELPTAIDATEVQVCLTLRSAAVDSPYIPTDANTCAGTSPDLAYVNERPVDVVLVDVAAFFGGTPGYQPGAALWFTVHVIAEGRTLAVTGASTPNEAVTRTLTVTKDFVPDTPTATATASFTVDCLATDLGARGTFQLGDGGVMVLTGIADGDECHVVETTAGYSTTAAGVPGTSAIVFLDRATVVPFVNRSVHVVSIMKTVVGSDAAFQFTVDCSVALSRDNNPSTLVSYLDGDAIAVLGDGDTLDLAGIPHGTVCTIGEQPAGRTGGTWTTTINGVPSTASTTVAVDDHVQLVFRNELAVESAPVVAPEGAVPQAQPGAQVLGHVEDRELAATGDQVALSVTVALALLVVGALAIVLARPREED